MCETVWQYDSGTVRPVKYIGLYLSSFLCVLGALCGSKVLSVTAGGRAVASVANSSFLPSIH